MYENEIVWDYRDGKVTKEELDDLSAASRKQLKDGIGEKIVDEDIL